MRLNTKLLFLFGLIMAVFTLPVGASVDVEHAQTETGDAEIEFTGVITAITDSTIVVNGLSVQVDQAEIEVELVLGATVKIEGVLQPNAIIIAYEIEDPDDVPSPEVTPEVTPELTPEVTPEATPEATAEPDDDDDDDNVVIVIRGPVQEINVNIITIYDIDIVVNADDPILNVINVGDELEIEGVLDGDDIFDDDDDDDDGVNITIVIIAINITFIDVDVYINDDGQAWRDPGNCQNGPPPWAPAHGWRRRCENPGGRGGGGRSGSGSSGSGSGSGS